MGRVIKTKPNGIWPLWGEVALNHESIETEVPWTWSDLPQVRGSQVELFDLSVIEATRRETRGPGAPRAIGLGRMKLESSSARSKAKHIDRVREQARARSARNYASKAIWLRQIKEQAGCSVCGERFHASLDFHHLDPSAKKGLVTAAKSRQQMRSEMRKCVLLCKNCHYKVHYEAMDISHLLPFDPDVTGRDEDPA